MIKVNLFLGKILIFFLFFNYLYGIHYQHSPLSSPALIGALGFSLSIIFPVFRSFIVNNSVVRKFILIMLPTIFVALLSIILNQSSDVFFLKWGIVNILYLMGAMTLVYLIENVWGRFDTRLLVEMMACSAILQLSIALLMWTSPSLHEVLYSITYVDEIGQDAIDRTAGKRLMGFGTNFFGSGVLHGFILISMICLYGKMSFIKTVLWSLSFIFITAIGMMMARTTLLGTLIALSLLCIYIIKGKIKKNTVWGILMAIIILIWGISLLSSSAFDDFQTIVNFGFQMFISKQETGEVYVDSWDSMMSMYRFPSDFETWIIGDAHWMGMEGGYYMSTDIGFIRMIFYFGIIGLLSYIIYNVKLLRAIHVRNHSLGMFFLFALMVYVMVVNLKGFVDIFQWAILFYFCEDAMDNNNNNNNNKDTYVRV